MPVVNPPALNFTSTDNDLAYKLYRGLIAQGASLADMDGGEGITNYIGTACPDGASTCLVGAGDNVVTSSEVFEYTLNRYEKYQKLIEGTLGHPLPWVLDDLSPQTTFDAEVRARVQAAIDKLKFTLTTVQGLQQENEEYAEKLALGIFYLAMVPDKGWIQQNRQLFDETTTELVDRKMEWFRNYLRENGGFQGEKDYFAEYTALESIKSGRGKCTEESKKLFAFFKMAGFSPVFVEIPVAGVKVGDPFVNQKPRISKLLNEELKNLLPGTGHVCIGLQIGGRFRLFDAAFLSSDTRFQLFNPITLRQYLGDDMSNRGVAWGKKGEFDKAIADHSVAISINPQYAEAYTNRGNAWNNKGEFDKAIADYSVAISINPQFAEAYNNRGIAWASKGEFDKAIADHSVAISINPQFAEAYTNRGIAWRNKGEFDKAIADHSVAISINPQYAVAYTNRGVAWVNKGEFDKAIADHSVAISINPQFAEAYNNRGVAWGKKGEFDKAIADFSVAISINPQYAEAYTNREHALKKKAEVRKINP